MKNRILTLSLILSLFTGQAGAMMTCEIDSLLQELDREISQAEHYIDIRKHAIDSAQSVFLKDTLRYEAALAVAQLYAPYQCDSAINWYKRAERLAGGNLQEEEGTAYRRCVGRKEGFDVPFPRDTLLLEALTPAYAINACLYGHDKLALGDTLGAIEWLTRSALTDVRLGITDNEAIWQLAHLLSEQEGPSVMRAYNYIEYSCRNEDIFKAELRYTQIGPIAHTIAEKFREMIRKEYLVLRKSFITIAVIATLLAVSILLLFIYVRKLKRANKEMAEVNRQLDKSNKELDQINKELDQTNKELDLINRELNEMNQTREHYICSYLEEKSAYIKQLYKESIKAGAPGSKEKFQERLDAYYNSFDTTFLRLYPNFVDQINSLIRLDSQFNPPKGTLTPELRIFALIRLGITRSTRISELLCLSANTVYSYRSRVKNLCTGDREEFETKVRQL